MLIFDVVKLAGKSEGFIEKLNIDEPVEFDPVDKIKPLTNFTAEGIFVKLSYEISVQLYNCAIDVSCECSLCLKKYTEHVFVQSATREFLIDLPKSQMDVTGEEFFVDRKYLTISLFEMVRQEIILHLPAVPVCSTRCKGLCPRCGIDMNESSCSCK